MDTGLNKSSNKLSAIAKHLLNNYDCAKNFNDNHSSNVSKNCNDYHLSVLKALFINLFNLIYASNCAFINIILIGCYKCDLLLIFF